MLNKGLPEAHLLHPPLAVRARIVEASWRLYEHVQAHEQPEGILRPVVIDDGLVDNQRAALGQRVMGFFEERQLLLDVPVVQDVPHDEDVRGGERIFEEVPSGEREAALETERFHIGLEHRADGRQVKLAAAQVRVRERYLDRDAALRAADINERLVLLPRELLRNRDR